MGKYLSTTFENKRIATENHDVIAKFCKKHSLPHKYLHKSNHNNLFSKQHFEWEKFPQPNTISTYAEYLERLNLLGAKVNITGQGGNEIYSCRPIESKYPHQAYLRYYELIEGLHKGAKNIFTNKGIDILIDRQLYSKSITYPIFQTESVAFALKAAFAPAWDTNICILDPFSDPRLIKLFWCIPVSQSTNKLWDSHSFWKTISNQNIFLNEQLGSKKLTTDPEDEIRFASEKRDYIYETLLNSPLNKTNYFKIKQITTDFWTNKHSKYLKYDTVFYLINLVKVSHYLSQLYKQGKLQIN
jgi:hypothetical protein